MAELDLTYLQRYQSMPLDNHGRFGDFAVVPKETALAILAALERAERAEAAARLALPWRRATVADQTHSSRDVIREVVDEWAEEWRHPHGSLISLSHEERSDLAERICEALFGDELPSTGLTPDRQRAQDRDTETRAGWPTGHEMVVRLREALGLFAGAMPITPERAWEEALDEVARLRHRPLDEHPLPWRTGGHPADEPGPRQRTIYDRTGEMIGAMFTTAAARIAVDAVNVGGSFASLAELAEEIRRVLEVSAGMPTHFESRHAGFGVPLADYPRIAALLREPAAQPDRTPTPEE